MAEQIPFEYQVQFGEASEKEKLAQLLAALRQQQAQQAQGQMVSGHYVPPSPMQGLAQMFAAWQQGKATRDASKLRQGITGQMAKDEGDDRARIVKALTGDLEAMGPPDPQGGMGLRGNMPNPVEASQLALASKFPNMQKFGEQLRQGAASNFSAMAPRATPQSLDIAQAQGGNPMALTAKPEETYGPVEDFGPGLGQESRTTGKVAWAPKGVNVTTNVGDRAEAQIVSDAAKEFRSQPMKDRVQSLKTTLDTGTFAWRILDEGNLNLGLDTDIKTFAQKLAGVLGLAVDPRVPATEVYNSFIIPQVGRIIKMFGAGTGLSDADREFATKAVAMAKNDPRMINVALAFALRGASKELQGIEAERMGLAEMATKAKINPLAFGQPIQWAFQVPKNASKDFPQNPYEPGALEEWGMKRLYGGGQAPLQSPNDAERMKALDDVMQRYGPKRP